MLPSPFRILPFFFLVLVLCFSVDGQVLVKHANRRLALNPLQVSKEDRRTVASTDAGRVEAVDVSDGYNSTYHLQFITMEPSSIFLPVILQSDMIIYVHTGRGKLSWADEDEVQHLNLERGDIYRLESGSVFYMHSNPDPMRIKLRVYAFFSTFTDENTPESYVGSYSTLSDLVFGFDRDVLQMAFKVPEVIVDEILKAGRPPLIVTAESRSETEEPDWKEQMIEELLRGSTESLQDLTNKKKKDKKKKSSTFNVFSSKPDFQNCNGWSLAVTNKDFKALRDSNIGVLAVNLYKGSMMGPHWNPRATEVAIVTQGQGMVRVICPSEAAECKSSRFRVGEGDVFVVPRYHPMAQISFNNDSFAFVGFSTRARYNRPQFLAGKSSVLRALDVDILAKAFNVSNTTMNQLLSQRTDSIILDCTSCAEEELRKMEEGEERGPEEEEGEEEEERRPGDEEEERRPGEEEEERRKKEEEERRRREEEEGGGGREEERKRREEEEEEEGRGGREEEEEERRKREEEEEGGRGGREEEKEEERGGGEDEEGRGGGGGERRRRKWKKVWRV